MSAVSTLPTVNYLHPIVAIEDDTIVLRSGILLAVLACRSSGLALRTDDEADTIIQTLKRQLLALRYVEAIVVEVAPVDVRQFLARHARATAAEADPRLARLAALQRRYIAHLSATRRILEHRSFVVVAVPPPLMARRSDGAPWRGRAAPHETLAQRRERRTELAQRCGRVAHLFGGIDIDAHRLSTRELLDLVQRCAAPDQPAGGPPLARADDLATGPVVLAVPELAVHAAARHQ